MSSRDQPIDTSERTARFRSVASVLRPTSIAIVGASDRGESGWSEIIFDNLKQAGFPIPVHLINPHREHLWGHPCHPSFEAIGVPIDHALVLVPAPVVAKVLEEAARNGVRSATIYSAGFGEGDAGDVETAARSDRLAALVHRYDIRLCGPNCMGTVAVAEGLTLYPSKRVHGLNQGYVGAVFQSGGTLQFWIEQAANRGLSFSYAVTSGNELDLDLADYLNFLVDDPNTKLIACLIEGVRRPEALLTVAQKALAAGKPILAVKSGRTEKAREQAKSHTGALAGDDAVFDAVCLRYGIIRCESLGDMIEIALAFEPERIPDGDRMALVTTSGAVKGLALDAAAKVNAGWGGISDSTRKSLRGRLPAVVVIDNPLDCGPAPVADVNLYSNICQTVVSDDNVDMLAFLSRTPLQDSEPDRWEPFAELARSTQKPVIAFAHNSRPTTAYAREFQRKTGLPFIHGIPQSLLAMDALARYGAATRAQIPKLPSATGNADDLKSDSIKRRIVAAGFGIPEEALARCPDEAAELASRIGFPVAVKLVSTQASHKTDVGGVRLGLRRPEDVAAAARDIAQGIAARHAEIEIDGYLVQRMVSGLEVIAGFRIDDLYGPIAVLGLGGIHVEVLHDMAIRLLPVTVKDVAAMIGSLRCAPLFAAYRGQPTRDTEALARAVAATGDAFLTLRNCLADLEINPIIVGGEGEGIWAVDIRPVARDLMSAHVILETPIKQEK